MLKKRKADGVAYYYYYKKKKGRHKKRGRKKSAEQKPKYDGTWYFKIVKFDFNKEVEYVEKYRNLSDVEKKKKELIDKNNTVEFPVEYINNRRVSNKQYKYKSEYVILKKNTDETKNDNESLVRNEYGKLVKHITTGGKYYVYDKFPCVKEENFWVYGYNPRNDRKNFKWIRENLYEAYRNKSKKLLINICAYKNKILFSYDGTLTEFVICKNQSDAIRMYNKLHERYGEDKFTIFSGMAGGHDWKTTDIVEKLRKLTGWSLEKIYTPTTSK